MYLALFGLIFICVVVIVMPSIIWISRRMDEQDARDRKKILELERQEWEARHHYKPIPKLKPSYPKRRQ